MPTAVSAPAGSPSQPRLTALAPVSIWAAASISTSDLKRTSEPRPQCFSFQWHHGESSLDRQMPFICSVRRRRRAEDRASMRAKDSRRNNYVLAITSQACAKRSEEHTSELQSHL